MSIEALSKQFPDVPVPILIKTEAIRAGVSFTPRAQQALANVNTCFKGYGVFSMDRERGPVTIEQRIPSVFCLSVDDATVGTRITPSSPYKIDAVDGHFSFCDETGPLEGVYFPPAPSWIDQKLPDGTPLQAIAQPSGLDKVFCTLNYYCEYWKHDEECRFCDIVSFLKVKKRKEHGVQARPRPDQVVQTLNIAFREPGYRHIILTGGTVLTQVGRRDELGLYCDYLSRIRDEAFGGHWWSAYFQVGARPKADIQRLRDTGIPALHHNTEVWDEELWPIICPGKARTVGREEWVRRMYDSVDVFGKGHILSNFVSGVEMAQPYGFKDVKQAVKSTLNGFDQLMAHGVLPRMDMWCVEDGSALAGQAPPPLEYYIELEKGYLDLRLKHGFPFPFVGYCRGCTSVDALSEWDYYFVKLPEKKAREAEGARAVPVAAAGDDEE